MPAWRWCPPALPYWGLLYKQIAERLGCSERTVKFHKARIAEKLGVKTSAEIALRLSSTAKNKWDIWALRNWRCTKSVLYKISHPEFIFFRLRIVSLQEYRRDSWPSWFMQWLLSGCRSTVLRWIKLIRSRIISFFLASFSASLLVRLAGLLASISCRSQNAASSA